MSHDKPSTTPQDGSSPKKGEVASHRRKRHFFYSEDSYTSVIDELIRDAQERGEFDDLPGAGKPLQIDKNEYAGDNELAYKILKDNNFTLPWIANRNAILQDIERFRAKIERQWQLQGLSLQALARSGRRELAQYRWRQLTDGLQTELDVLNKRIFDMNLTLPVRHLTVQKLILADELKRAGARLTL